jgi:transcriptional regulator with XRE-family HTH domain
MQYIALNFNKTTKRMNLAQTIKQRREELGISMEHLAEVATVSLRTLKAIESGKGNPTLSSINKLADVLGLEMKLEVKNK